MPKVITAIVESDGYDGELELWDCAYESIEQAKADAVDYLESIRAQSPGSWQSVSYIETTAEHGRRGRYSMVQYDQPHLWVILELRPLVLG